MAAHTLPVANVCQVLRSNTHTALKLLSLTTTITEKTTQSISKALDAVNRAKFKFPAKFVVKIDKPLIETLQRFGALGPQYDDYFGHPADCLLLHRGACSGMKTIKHLELKLCRPASAKPLHYGTSCWAGAKEIVIQYAVPYLTKVRVIKLSGDVDAGDQHLLEDCLASEMAHQSLWCDENPGAIGTKFKSRDWQHFPFDYDVL